MTTLELIRQLASEAQAAVESAGASEHLTEATIKLSTIKQLIDSGGQYPRPPGPTEDAIESAGGDCCDEGSDQ